MQRLGQSELDARIVRSFHRLLDTTDRWRSVERRSGPGGVESAYRSLLEGDAEPDVGFVVAMHEVPIS